MAGLGAANHVFLLLKMSRKSSFPIRMRMNLSDKTRD